jgi:hypothetical protein
MISGIILLFFGGKGAAVAALPVMTGAGAGLAEGADFAGSTLPGGLAAEGGTGEGFAGGVCAGFAGGVDAGFCGGVTTVAGLAGITAALGGSTGFDGGVMMTAGLGGTAGVGGLAGTTGFAGS